MRPHTEHNENGGVTEVSAAVSTERTGAIRATDEMESMRAALTRQACDARAARIIGTIRLVRLYEGIFGGPVRRNVLGRTRNGDGEDMPVCPRCLSVMQDEARCANCGRHAERVS